MNKKTRKQLRKLAAEKENAARRLELVEHFAYIPNVILETLVIDIKNISALRSARLELIADGNCVTFLPPNCSEKNIGVQLSLLRTTETHLAEFEQMEVRDEVTFMPVLGSEIVSVRSQIEHHPANFALFWIVMMSLSQVAEGIHLDSQEGAIVRLSNAFFDIPHNYFDPDVVSPIMLEALEYYPFLYMTLEELA